jgi:hypothetical protein
MDKYEEVETTKEMVIPIVNDDEIIFGLRDKPGVLFVGTRNYFNIERINGHGPYEISWEQAVTTLNSNDWFGKKPELKYYEELPQAVLEELWIDINVDDL